MWTLTGTFKRPLQSTTIFCNKNRIIIQVPVNTDLHLFLDNIVSKNNLCNERNPVLFFGFALPWSLNWATPQPRSDISSLLYKHENRLIGCIQLAISSEDAGYVITRVTWPRKILWMHFQEMRPKLLGKISAVRIGASAFQARVTLINRLAGVEVRWKYVLP